MQDRSSRLQKYRGGIQTAVDRLNVNGMRGFAS
jgi:hypothetical protein